MIYAVVSFCTIYGRSSRVSQSHAARDLEVEAVTRSRGNASASIILASCLDVGQSIPTWHASHRRLSLARFQFQPLFVMISTLSFTLTWRETHHIACVAAAGTVALGCRCRAQREAQGLDKGKYAMLLCGSSTTLLSFEQYSTMTVFLWLVRVPSAMPLLLATSDRPSLFPPEHWRDD